MSEERVPGTLLTHPKIRALVACAPTGARGALRVRVFTPAGLEILNLRAVEVETAVVEIPLPPGSTPALEKAPGSIWFYGQNGETIGFTPDAVLPTLARPLALERPPKGPTTPWTIAGLQEALRGILGGLENLSTYLVKRARKAGNGDLAADVDVDLRALVKWAGDTSERTTHDRRARFANAIADALRQTVAAASTSTIATDESRAAALRLQPVIELAERVVGREIDLGRAAGED